MDKIRRRPFVTQINPNRSYVQSTWKRIFPNPYYFQSYINYSSNLDSNLHGIMFKKLKSQVQEAVTEKLSTITGSPTQPSSIAGDLSHRSRTNSFSSIASADSTIPNLFGNYTTPPRKYYPPSDVGSDIEDASFVDSPITLQNESPYSSGEVKKLNKLLDIYKNKFNQLKEAYSESEAEKEKIKKVLAESQDKVLRRVHELKEQAEIDKKLRKDQEFQMQMQLQDREDKINSLKAQLTAKDIINTSKNRAEKLIDLDTPDSQTDTNHDELKAKVTKLETLLSRCKELIKTQKSQLLEKEKSVNDQAELLEKKSQVEKDLTAFKTRIEETDLKLKNMQEDYELRLNASNDMNASLNTSVERLQKRCADLNMELDEKAHLFQTQFQVFQQEFVDKEEGLKTKLKLLQEDYLNLDNELAREKTNGKQMDAKVDSELVKTSDVVQLDATKLAEQENKLRELNANNQKLKEELETLGKNMESKSSASTIQIDQLKDINSQLESKLTESEAKLNDLTQINTELNKTIEELNQVKADSDKQRVQFNSELENKFAEIEQMKADYETDLNQKLKDNEHTARNTIQEYKEKIEALEKQSQNEDNSLKDLNKSLMQNLKEARSNLDEQVGHVKTLNDRVAQLEDTQKALTEKIEELEKERESLNNEVDAKKQEIKDQIEKSTHLASQLDAEVTRNKGLEEQQMNSDKTSKKEVKDLKKKVNKLELKNSELEKKLTEGSEHLDGEVNKLVKGHEEEIEALNDARSKLEEENEQAARSFNERIQELEDEMRDIKEVQAVLNEQTKSLEEEKQALKERVDEANKGLDERDTAVKKYQTNEAELTETINRLEAEKSVIEAKLAEETLALNDSMQSLSKKEAEKVQMLEVENAKLQEKMRMAFRKREPEEKEQESKDVQSIESIKVDRVALVESNQNLELKVKELDDNIQKLKEEKDHLSNQIEQMNKDHEAKIEVMVEKSHLENVIQNHREEKKAYADQMNKLEEEYSKLQDQSKSLQEKLESEKLKSASGLNYLADIKDLNATVTKLNDELEQLKKDHDLRLENMVEKSLVEAMTRKNLEEQNVFNEQINELETQIRHLNDTIKSLNQDKDGQILKLQEKLDKDVKDVKELDDNIQKLKEEKDHLSNQIEQMNKDHEAKIEVMVEKSHLENVIQNHREEKEAYADQMNKLEEEYSKLQSKTESLQASLDEEMNNSVDRTELDRLVKEHELEQTKLGENIKLLENEKSILAGRVENLRRDFEIKLEGLTDKVELEKLSQVHQVKQEMLAATIQALEVDKAKLQTDLGNNRAEVESIRASVDKATEKHEKEIKQLKEDLEEAVNTKSASLQDMQAIRIKHEKEIESYQPKLSKLEDCLMDILNLNVKIQSLAEEKGVLEVAVKDKEDEIEQGKERLIKLEEENIALKKGIQREMQLAKTQLDEVINKNAIQTSDLNKLMEKSKSDYEQLLSENKSLSESLTTKLIDAKSEKIEYSNQLLADQKLAFDQELQRLQECLKHAKIDLDAANTKLAENLKDYKNSIAKLKTASNQRYSKLKKKFNNCLSVLTLVSTVLFPSNEANKVNEQPDSSILSAFLAYLPLAEKTKNQNEVHHESSPQAQAEPADDQQLEYEFDENKFREFFELKRTQFENNPKLLENIATAKLENSSITAEMDQLKKQVKEADEKFKEAELKFKEDKEKSTLQNERDMDDLQLKLANLDLKYKQLTLEDNKESYAIKRRLNTVEEELVKVVKEKEDLIKAKQTGEQKHQKSLSDAKHKADLRVAALKKQFENDSSAKNDDLVGRNQQLQARLKEQSQKVESLRTDCEDYASKLNLVELEMEQKLASEAARHDELVDMKVKHYEQLIAEIESKHIASRDMDQIRIENLKAELENVPPKVVSTKSLQSVSNTFTDDQKKYNQQLEEQLQELKFSYDELQDEKDQLFLTVSELRQKKSDDSTTELRDTIQQLNASMSVKDRIIASYETKMNVNKDNSFSSFLDKKENDVSLSYMSGGYRANGSSQADRSLMTELSEHETSRLNTSQNLEHTEVDYLKSIVYSYMMGTDPITMAKVIVAVLKFSDEEKRRLLENEKVKQSWFSVVGPS